ncbi:hypothetical protein [Gottfriedia acidiceleris]|uniref:hypothetical protein n=1 Tax=Gottfriedia acidiceleris TaxID=371036 RepID=UPI00101DE619|nr:hypothetical protein [Gottfriedia acidiceleris]
MKRKYTFLLMALLIAGIIISALSFFRNTKYQNRTIINGIENFKPNNSDKKENFLLFYPADPRVSQESTIVKEVTKKGEIVREYAIKDSDFGRMLIHQKPNNLNKLFISFFGDASIDNYFFTYDMAKRKFDKVNLEYFKYPVGVDHIQHYGEDTLFQTIVSHKTGDQNIDQKTNDFNMSISNYSSEKSFETEYGYEPKWTPLLGFKNKIFYGTSGEVNEKETKVYPGIGIIDLENQLIHYESPESNDVDLFPVYSTKDHVYIVSDTGKLYAYINELKYEVSEPFKNLQKQDFYYYQEFRPLMIDEKTALYNLYSYEYGNTLGLLTFEPVPTFKPLKKSYVNNKNNYKFIYQDIENEEIYVLSNNEESYKILILDNKTFDLKVEFPVEYGHLLDFIVRI